MANTENIEAKLCAYVDGELDAAGRAEIEAHLEINPQHRQLMQELMSQRSMLRDIPRAGAPDDLLESVQGQLERSVLLDGGGPHEHEAHVIGRINPWPRVFGIAAVLVLGIGLAAVIFLMLPKQQGDNFAITATPATSESASLRRDGPATAPEALARTVAPAPSGDLGTTDRDLPEGRGSSALAGKAPGEALVAHPPAPPAAPPAEYTDTLAPEPRDIFAKGGADARGKAAQSVPAYSNIFQNAPAVDPAAVEDTLRQSGVGDNSLLVVVCAENPTQANLQLQDYFVRNNIRWEELSEPMPQPLNLPQQQAVLPSRAQNLEVRLKQAPPAAAATEAPAEATAETRSRDLAGADAAQQQQARPGALAEASQRAGQHTDRAAKTDSEPVAAPASVEQSAKVPSDTPPAATASPVRDQVMKKADASIAMKQEAAPATQPMQRQPTPLADGQQSPRSEADKEVEAAQQVESATQPSFALNAATQTAPVASQQFIIARGLTSRQVDELNASINVQNSGRVAAFHREIGGNYTPAALPVVPAQGETMSLQHGVSASTQPTTQPAPLADANFAREDETKATTQAVADAVSAPPATTRPSGGESQAAVADAGQKNAAATTAPVGGSVAPAAPEGAPAVATTLPSTQPGRFDVVIVVQPDVAAAQIQQFGGQVQSPAPAIEPDAPAAAPAPEAAAPTTAPAAAQPAPVQEPTTAPTSPQ